MALLSAGGDGQWRASGALTFATARGAAAQGALLTAGRPGELSVDCAGVSDCDSAGLAVLIDWMAQVRRAGGTLRYTSLPSRLLALARISEVEELLQGG